MKPNPKIEGKVVVVTGGAAGIGRAMLLRFAAEKPRALVVADRDLSAAQSVAKELGAVEACAVACDVGREADIVALAERVQKDYGDTKLVIELEQPARKTLTVSLRDLAESSEVLLTGDFPKESAVLNRLVFNENFETSFEVKDTGNGSQADWYYVRVFQSNGQLAWSSPIWVG